MVGDFLFKSADHEFLTSHQDGKMTESKTEKKTVWVKKVVEALGDS